MIDDQLRAGPIRVKLADAIRRVNAAHAEVGGGENQALKECWLALDRSLQLAALAGDERAAHVAVDRYRDAALAAVADQAQKTGGAR